jgi:NDP-sugar pyrophosphorylase family protein
MRTDGSQIHNGDMVVVTGPLVSNHDVQATLAKHKATKKKDKAMIMTLALKRLGRWHRTRSAADATLWGIDKDSQELLIYDTEGDSKKLMKIETDLLKQSRSLTLANDMIDTRVYVCTPQVLIEFESNFDFHTMEQLVADLLLNAELYGHKMFVDEVSDRHYAAPVRCVHSYDAVSRDVLARWVYPNALDTHWHHRPSAKEPNAIYACARGNSYKEASARLSRSAKQGPNSALGRGTTVGENSVLERCVVGDGCRIGENCKLYDCYVWPGCVIEDGVTITNAVVASNCRLGAGCTVSQGCLVGENCAIGAGFTLQPYHRITTVKEKPPVLNSPRGLDGAAAAAAAAEEEEEEESESSEDSVDEDFDDDTDDEAPSGAADAAAAAREERADRLAKEAAEAAAAAAAAAAEPAPEPAMVWPADEVGEGGVGRLWTEDDPEPEPEPAAAAAAAAAADGLEEIVLPGARGPLADYSNAIGYTVARPRPMNALLPESDEEVEAAEENTLWNPSAAGKARFVDEMRDTLKTRMAENCALETILFEMKSLRLSHNADIVVDLLPAVVPALLGSAPYDPEAAASKEYTKALKKVLKQWGGLIEAFLRDTQDQLALLGTVFDWVCDGDDDELPPSAAAGGGGPDKAARIQQVGYIIQFLYEFDVVEPEVSQPASAMYSYKRSSSNPPRCECDRCRALRCAALRCAVHSALLWSNLLCVCVYGVTTVAAGASSSIQYTRCNLYLIQYPYIIQYRLCLSGRRRCVRMRRKRRM